MLKQCNILCAYGEKSGGHSRALDSFEASFADRGTAGKELREAPMRPVVTDVAIDNELNQRREILQASLRRAGAIIEKQCMQWERRTDSDERLSETVRVAAAAPEPKLSPDWNTGLTMARSYAGELRKLLFNSCCQLQREASSVDLHELSRVVALLKVAEKREKELAHVVDWARSMAIANGEDIG
jgi:hypothetical protein